ncbi:class I SAM-dependent methyltransferase [uncultured Pseudodesulfovibrio sp.]|uniref:class I SAM-dependent methyltransferase n=1 Tax=uncultured Pseudodesulfovibrio sp. TaxID=2035858 RepID=UPI0029C744DF|nr:class I SAM-dependent methyltransferase [uncultured Pseudodesulfovibrio sp.]
MESKPKAAGKSSIDLIDQDLAFDNIMVGSRATYLDLGCGAGNYTLALARRLGAGSLVYALDLWEEGIAALTERAREEGLGNVEAKVADLSRTLDLPTGSVDAAFMATVLHDLPEEARPGLMEEIKRVLVPGGVLALIEFKKFAKGPGPSDPEKRIGPEDADRLTAPHGFVHDTVVDLGEVTYLVRYIGK